MKEITEKAASTGLATASSVLKAAISGLAAPPPAPGWLVMLSGGSQLHAPRSHGLLRNSAQTSITIPASGRHVLLLRVLVQLSPRRDAIGWCCACQNIAFPAPGRHGLVLRVLVQLSPRRDAMGCCCACVSRGECVLMVSVYGVAVSVALLGKDDHPTLKVTVS